MNCIQYIFLILVLIVIGVCMFSYTMNNSMMNDEHMYVSAGVLAQENTIYQDFAYLQMPYLPLIYSAIYKITGTEYYLLYARLFSFLAVFASVIVIYLLGNLITRSFALSLIGVLLYSFNEIIIHSAGFAWNAAPPLLFSLLGIYFFLKKDEHGVVKPLYLFLAGLGIAIAGGIKLYYLIMIIPYFGASLHFRSTSSWRHTLVYSLLPLSAGFLTGLMPALYYFFSDPELFIFNNLGFHALNYAWHLENNLLTAASTSTLLSKLRYIIQVAGWQTNMPVFFAVTTGLILIVLNYKSIKNVFMILISKRELFVISTIFIIAFISALQPSSLWQHHLAFPFPFVILLIFSSYALLDDMFKKIFLSVAAIAALLVAIYGFPIASLYAQHLTLVERWTPVRFHHESHAITGHLHKKERVATIEPLIALEGGMDIHPEFATGYFLFQVSEKLEEREKVRYITTSLQSLADWIEKEKPAVIIIPVQYRSHNIFYESIMQHTYSEIEKLSDNYSIFVWNRNSL
jgi:4-amino-4-deoxy-L-arabinose transferase-like glycosyltransferase